MRVQRLRHSGSKPEVRQLLTHLWRRRRCVRLVEELGLRTQRIEAMIPTLEDFVRRIKELRLKIDAHKKSKQPPAGRQKLVDEYRMILKACQETPKSLKRRVAESTESSSIACTATPRRS